MAEDTQKAKNEPVAEPQDAPMPSADDKKAEVLEKTPEESLEEAQKTEGLPEDAKVRTKKVVDEALNEAKTYKQQLQEERARREYYEQLFSQMQQPSEETPQFTDPYTGEPDEKLNALARETLAAKRLAEEAKQASLLAKRDQENQRLFAAVPELNPDGESFNRELHKLTRSFLLDSLTNPQDYGGKELDPIEAANMAKERLGNSEEVKKQAAEAAIEQLTPKEQASLEAVGSPSRRSELDDLAELRQKSRGRDEEARLARIERFKRITSQE